MEKLIGSFDDREGHEQVRIYSVESKGRTYISIRVYSYRAGGWHLTKNRITLPKTKAHELGKVLAEASNSILNQQTQ